MSDQQTTEQKQNLPAKREMAPLAIPVAADDPLLNYLDAGRFDAIQRTAKLYSESSLVPEHYQGKLANCFIAFEMASRLGIHPFMFMQNAYTVGGKPGLEAKLAIALVNQRGPFQGPIQWKWSGTEYKDDWTCTAYAIHRQTGEVCEASVDWKMVKAEGWLDKKMSKWQTMPKVMFRYRTASFLARLYCPEVLMGMSTIDENEDILPTKTIITDAQPINNGSIELTTLDLRAFERQIADLGISKAEARELAVEKFNVDRIEKLSRAQGDELVEYIKSDLKEKADANESTQDNPEAGGTRSEPGGNKGDGGRTGGSGDAQIQSDAERAAAGAPALNELFGTPAAS